MSNIKNIFISLVVFGVIFTAFIVFVTQMANQDIYSTTINANDSAMFARINASVAESYGLSKDITSFGQSVDRGDVVSSVWLIPKSIISIFTMPFKAMATTYNITTEMASVVGIPTYAFGAITAIIAIVFVFLIINAIGKRYD